MIPHRLTLKNFLSYREATLNFQGLHTACICGANGAGKSSLLEAIAWAIWGQSRAATEDDVIHMGAAEAVVDFVFVSHQQMYRVIRGRTRGLATTLELQVASSPQEFRSVTAKGVRATQQLIIEQIRLDYETFVNSAYLRQGRADEFMVKRPAERKQVLADLLKLSQYDGLAERAKDQTRQIKGQIDLLEQQWTAVQSQLQQGQHTEQEQAELEATIAALQAQLESDRQQLHAWQTRQQQRQIWEQQLNLQQQQHQNLHQDCRRLRQDAATAQQQWEKLESILQQADAIDAGYAQWQTLQRQEENLAARCQAYQALQTQRQQAQQHHTERAAARQSRRQQVQTQIAGLQQQETEIQAILQKAGEVTAGLQQLQSARIALSQLDQLQTQVAPLLQRRQQIHTQLDRTRTRLAARLDELRATAQSLQTQQSSQSHLTQAVQNISDRIATLEKQRTYQQRVREKGLERRSFMERLQTNQREYETQLGELAQKLHLLGAERLQRITNAHQDPNLDVSTAADGDASDRPMPANLDAGASTSLRQPQEWVPQEWVPQAAPISPQSSSQSSLLPLDSQEWEFDAEGEVATHRLTKPLITPFGPPLPLPPCPLCDRPLDEHHWHLVLDKHRVEQQEILDQLWVVREQLAVSEREIQILRQEYWEQEQELAQHGTLLEQRGQLQAQLQATTGVQTQRQQILTEITQLEQTLQQAAFDPELREELSILDQSLQRLDYDDRNHALARGLVDRWRWAEIKQAEIKQAQRRQATLAQQLPELQAQLEQCDRALETLQTEAQTQLLQFDQELKRIDYDSDRHNQLRASLRHAQPWQSRHQELHYAQQQQAQVQQNLQRTLQTLHQRHQQFQQVEAQLTEGLKQLQSTPDFQTEVQALTQTMQQRRSHLDTQLANLGRLQQQQQHLAELATQEAALKAKLHTTHRQQVIYQELANAFGKNGIQTLMIENILPQLEAETNHILSRLSNNQLHIQFITQRNNVRSSKSQSKSQFKSQSKSTVLATGSAPKSAPKPIETLDILIADAQGTRPYETYSGGEAFRVNFAIRLALSKLLAQRSGTALQLLIIDEGFGTQDAEGCDRLIAAINAIAADFACILTVTHVPHFKEAFQSRIEVYKTDAGSKLSLSI